VGGGGVLTIVGVFWYYVYLYVLCFVLFVLCFILLRLCIFILICFISTSVRTTATEGQINCSNNNNNNNI